MKLSPCSSKQNTLGLHAARRLTSLLSAVVVLGLSGCATMPGWIATSGASREQVMEEGNASGRIEGIELVDVDDALARRLSAEKRLGLFSDVFTNEVINSYFIGPGDVIEVSVWEAPPAMLFGSLVLDPGAGGPSTNVVTLPSQMVSPEGTISVPFAGHVQVEGRNTREIEVDIAKRLTGKAHQPQVLVRVVENNTSSVTVVGEVNASVLMPLTPKGERLLDALAAGGGLKQPVNRMAVQVSRDETTATMPLDSVIRDPRQNIVLKPGDVVTAVHQPQSFSVLGATGRNEEITFEAQGISLAQALARAGGLVDNRADARGVFIFRFEEASLVESPTVTLSPETPTRPVIYQVDLRDPASFFVTQNFPIQDNDVIYVANAPSAEFEKFLRMVVSVAAPAVTYNRVLQ